LVEHEPASTSDRLFAVAGHPPDDAALSRARFALLRVRRDVHAQRPLRATDVAAAGPLVIDEVASSLEPWEQSPGAWTTAREIYRSSWHTAMTESHRRLVSIAASPLVEHGL